MLIMGRINKNEFMTKGMFGNSLREKAVIEFGNCLFSRVEEGYFDRRREVEMRNFCPF